MIDYLKDGNQMSISVFDNKSNLIILLSRKSEILFLEEKIDKIQTRGGKDLYEALKGDYEILKLS